jgi:hypothetical protein
MLPKVMRAWQAAARSSDRGSAEEHAHADSDGLAAVCSMAMPQQRTVRPNGESLVPAKFQELINFSRAITGQGNQA